MRAIVNERSVCVAMLWLFWILLIGYSTRFPPRCPDCGIDSARTILTTRTLHFTAPGCIAALQLALVRSTSVLAGSTLARLARAGCNLAQRGATPLVLFRTWRRALARSLSVEVLGVQVVRLSRAGVFGRAGPPSMSSREGTM